MRRIGFLLISVLIFGGISSASDESVIKGGVILNKGDEDFYSWLIIHESSYFIKDFISIGYETQFSYYKVKSIFHNAEYENSAYPLNIFFNSKVKILKKGTFRPFVGAGFGLMTNIVSYPDRFRWEKFNAFHLMAGIYIGKVSQAALQIEFRVLSYDKEGSNTKFLLAAGLSY